MAATNFTPIQLYFSTTASAVPLAANLAQGELAINITDGKLYYEDNAGVVQVIATKGAGTIGGSNTQIQYNNAGALAGNAAMTFNSGTNTTTLTTLNLTNALGATYGGTAQSAYTQGDVLYASATNTLAKLGIGTVNYILTSTGSVPQWSAPSSIIVQTATNLAGGLAGSVPYQSALDTTTFLAIGAANRVMTSTGSAPQWVTSLTGLTGVSSSSITNTSLTSGRVVVSTTAGLQADDADLTFDGTTLSAGGFSTVGLSTLVKTVKIGDSSFNGVAVFAAATPAKLYMGTGTVTDVTSAISATNAIGAIASLGITPIAATNTSVTYTNAATLYIAGAPSAGTNITITNPYALYVAAGDAYFGGTVTAGTVNLTTLDLTNLEVTNIKAKDGTASITLADTTGVASFTANPILSGGTANGVTYLNGSKVLTSGSALTFDGTQLGVNVAAPAYATIHAFAAGGATFRLDRTGAGTTTIQSVETGVAYRDLTLDAANNIFSINTTEGMRLTSTGLGIGTSSPLAKLDVAKTSSDTVSRTNASGVFGDFQSLGAGLLMQQTLSSPYGFALQAANAANNLQFPLLLNPSGGNVGVGVTPQARLNVQYADSAPTSSGTISSGVVLQYATGGVALNMGTSSSGYSYFNSAYANNAGVAAAYRFYQGATQAMTLDVSGNLVVGATSIANSERLRVAGAGGANTEIVRIENSTNTSGYSGIVSSIQQNGNNTNTWHFRGNTNAVSNWYLYGNGTTSYSSDARLKKNIETTRSGYIEDLCKLRVVKYNWKNDADGTPKELGLIAQEVEQVFAGLVQDDPSKISEDDDTVYKQIKGSVLPFMLLKAIQEQQAIITQLKARLDAANL